MPVAVRVRLKYQRFLSPPSSACIRRRLCRIDRVSQRPSWTLFPVYSAGERNLSSVYLVSLNMNMPSSRVFYLHRKVCSRLDAPIDRVCRTDIVYVQSYKNSKIFFRSPPTTAGCYFVNRPHSKETWVRRILLHSSQCPLLN